MQILDKNDSITSIDKADKDDREFPLMLNTNGLY